jgi:hypothetical protein
MPNHSPLRDELELRRHRALDALDRMMASHPHLHRRLGQWRRQELVDEIEVLLTDADAELLRDLSQEQRK